jgi:hypothetical protein
MIHQTKRSLERILVYGLGGAGKSYAALCIAAHLQPGRTMWIIETDPAYDRLLEDPEFEDIGAKEEWRWTGGADGAFKRDSDFEDGSGQLVVYHVDKGGWVGIRAAIEEVWERAERHDWIVVDNITSPWEKVVEWYWQEVFGRDMDDYLISIRKMAMAEVDEGDKAEGTVTEEKFSEWSFINPHYAKHFTDKMLNPPCHLYLTAEQGEVVKHFDQKQKDIWGMYGSLGVKPKGQKKAGHLTHTVLHLDHPTQGWVMTTVKDRSREELVREGWEDFALDYLVAVGGWGEGDGGEAEIEPVPQPRPRRRKV